MKTDFERMKKHSQQMGEKNDCAVKAVAIATFQEYHDVREMFSAEGRKTGCGTPRWMTEKVLNLLGRKLVDVTKHFRSKTVVSLSREVTPRDNLLVSTRGHVFCIQDGQVLDWTKSRRHRIIKICRILVDKDTN